MNQPNDPSESDTSSPAERADADESARIEQLELKMMDLELSLQQLNDVVLQQYRDIEKLRQHNTDLERKLDSMNEPGPSPSATDEVPPHY